MIGIKQKSRNWYCLRRGRLPLGLHRQELKTKKFKNIEIQYTKKHEKVKQNDRDQTKKVKIALLAIWAPSTWSSWTGTKSGLLAFFQISKGVKVLMYLG